MHVRRPVWWGSVPATLLLPTVVAMISVVGSSFASRWHEADELPLDWFGVGLLLVGPVALVFRRWNPPVALAVCVLALGAYLLIGYAVGPIFLATVVALFSAVAAGHRLAAYSIGGAAFVAFFLAHLIRTSFELSQLTGVALWLAILVAVSLAGEGWRARRERSAQAKAAQEEVERRRGSEERLRIAQELHDVLGHHVSLINVQAGVALYLMDDDPEQARTALTAIKQSSKDLLREMRSTLGVLRGVDVAPPHHPVPGLGQLATLAAETSAAGLPVDVDVDGTERDLPPSVDLAAYRIIQEALTNTRRHAGPARAAVRVTFSESELIVQVVDTGTGGPSRPSDEGGNGIPGMRERARALGGTLTAGPRAGGGFEVLAHLPIPQGRS